MFVSVKVKQMFERESETNDCVTVRKAFLSDSEEDDNLGC